MRLNNLHATKTKTQSESNFQKTLQGEQLTSYQSQIMIRNKLSKNIED